MKRIWQRLNRALSSVRLAVVLIALLILIAAVSTLVPQNQGQEFYADRFTGAATLITGLGLDHAFTSALFLVPLGLFTINLLFCTVGRISRELAGKLRHAVGPDIIHIGLILLIVSGVISMLTREESQIPLARGETVSLPGGYAVTNVGFETITYENGNPKNWETTLSVEKDGREIRSDVVRVNRPLRLGFLLLYQYAHGAEPALVLVSDQQVLVVSLQSVVRSSRGEVRIVSIQPETGSATIVVTTPEGEQSARDITPGSTVAGMSVDRIGRRSVSVLLVTYDPALALVLFSFVVIAAGLTVTVVRRVKLDKGSSE